ncbi:MAG: DUF5615 family PIN-like protein [Chitinophagales bacterium]|nr:DUF5615 family PIN-like protein [Chitinophagales bacterium]
MVVDVSTGKAIADFLIEKGYVVISIIDLNPQKSDDEILKIALKEKAIVITMDKDFGELVYYQSLNHCGVLLLRLEDETSENKIFVMLNLLSRMKEFENHFAVYKNGQLRIRK